MSVLLVSIDSAIFKVPEQYTVVLRIGNEIQRASSNERTCSPLFNNDCFTMAVKSSALEIIVYRSMGGSLDEVGACNKIDIN